MKARQLKRIQDVITPANWAFVILACYIGLWVVLRPTLKEFLILAVVDALATILVTQTEGKIYRRLYPDSAVFYSGIEPATVSAMNSEERLRLLEALFSFPRQRALYCYLTSFIKCIPAFALIVFYWEYPHSPLLQFAKILLLCLVTWTYFYRVVLVDNHQYASALIAKLHESIDLTESLDRFPVPFREHQLSVQEYGFLFSIFGFTLLLQLSMILSAQGASPGALALDISVAGTIGLALLTRGWITTRLYTADGLLEIHRQLERADLVRQGRTMPLDTLPLLALFGQSLNRLTRRIGRHEIELSALVLRQAEKSRFRYLGEMAALLAHDLSGPLHVAQFSASQLMETPEMPAEKRERYFQHLNSSINRAVELTTSLRSRIRNPETESGFTHFQEAHENVLSLLQAQIGLGQLAQVHLTASKEVLGLVLEIPRVDLIHVLDNLYRNAFEELTRERVADPKVRISLGPGTDEGFCDILVSDNGRGLGMSEFERLTTFFHDQIPSPSLSVSSALPEGLGLRLTRRLVEINGGELRLVETNNPGTTVCLRLKRQRPKSASQSSLDSHVHVQRAKEPSSHGDSQ